MSVMQSRRNFGAGILAGAAALLSRRVANAQFSEQDIIQGADVVSTGNVTLNQSASNEATFGVYVDGQLVTEDGVYQTNNGQVIVQNGRVVSTGDVEINQSGSNSQTTEIVYPSYDGESADTCRPGAVIANPDTGQLFYQRNDCCWYRACAERCNSDRCYGAGRGCVNGG